MTDQDAFWFRCYERLEHATPANTEEDDQELCACSELYRKAFASE